MEEGMASDDFEFTAADDAEAGQSAATLVSIERKETKEGDFFRVWHFKTVTGAELSGSSSLSSGPQSKAYRWARAIIGREPQPGARPRGARGARACPGREPQPGERAGFLFGKGCIVEVKVNDAGFAKVVEVYPNATRPATPQAAPAPVAVAVGAPAPGGGATAGGGPARPGPPGPPARVNKGHPRREARRARAAARAAAHVC